MSSISQPRCIRRIQGFISAGFDVEIYGFDRGVYKENAQIDGYTIHILDSLPSGGKYFKKFIKERDLLGELFSKKKDTKIVYYAFSFEIALICLINKKQYIYEIGDLVYANFPYHLISISFKRLDKFLIKKSLLTVMTSEGFYDYLYQDKKISNIIIQPNKVDSSFNIVERISNPIDKDHLVFSFTGNFRYPNTIFRFAHVVGKYFPQHTFYFYGDSILTNEVKQIANTYDNVKYWGSFRNPQDLQRIYNQIDIVVACYDVSTMNERIAEPNKLFESLFFNKPIIVSQNTFLAKQVIEKYKCGFEINATSDDNLRTFIDSLSEINFTPIIERMQSIQKENLIDDRSIRITNTIKAIL